MTFSLNLVVFVLQFVVMSFSWFESANRKSFIQTPSYHHWCLSVTVPIPVWTLSFFGHFLSSRSCSCTFQLKTLHLFSSSEMILRRIKSRNPGKLSYSFKHLFYFPSEAQFYTNLIGVDFVFSVILLNLDQTFGAVYRKRLTISSWNLAPLPLDRPVRLSQLFRPGPVKKIQSACTMNSIMELRVKGNWPKSG